MITVRLFNKSQGSNFIDEFHLSIRPMVGDRFSFGHTTYIVEEVNFQMDETPIQIQVLVRQG